MHGVPASLPFRTLNFTVLKHQVLFPVVFSLDFLTVDLQITSPGLRVCIIALRPGCTNPEACALSN